MKFCLCIYIIIMIYNISCHYMSFLLVYYEILKYYAYIGKRQREIKYSQNFENWKGKLTLFTNQILDWKLSRRHLAFMNVHLCSHRRRSLFYSAVLLCTDVMGRGVDIPNIHWVIQYDPPSSARYEKFSFVLRNRNPKIFARFYMKL